MGPAPCRHMAGLQSAREAADGGARRSAPGSSPTSQGQVRGPTVRPHRPSSESTPRRVLPRDAHGPGTQTQARPGKCRSRRSACPALGPCRRFACKYRSSRLSGSFQFVMQTPILPPPSGMNRRACAGECGRTLDSFECASAGDCVREDGYNRWHAARAILFRGERPVHPVRFGLCTNLAQR